MEIMKKDEIFIPRKFQEKISPQDTKEQKKIKANLNLMKLKAQTEILPTIKPNTKKLNKN